MLRASWTAKKTNKSILKEIDESRQQLTDVFTRIERLFGQVVRANGVETLFIEGKPDGKQDCSRVHLRWSDGLLEFTEKGFSE